MNELAQKFAETAPEVWQELVARTILFGWVGVACFGVLVIACLLGLIYAIQALKSGGGGFDDEGFLLLGIVSVLFLILGVLGLVSSISDVMYPLAAAAKSLF